jgi:large conductance mechanosensitive channel
MLDAFMAFFDDFKKFAFRGNVVDLAVGVVIGGAFGRIVSAVVDDVVMPLVSLFMPNGNWRGAGLVLRHKPGADPDTILRYGDLMGAVLDFFIISLVLFLLVKRILRAAEAHLVKHESAQAPTQRACPACLEKVPLAATRCRACTSALTPPEPTIEAPAD